MDNSFSVCKVEDRSLMSVAKREIHKKVIESGFSKIKTGEIDIIVAELTSNLIKHSHVGGTLVYRINHNNSEDTYLEIFCLDSGPGTNHIQRMLKDGVSSSNTMGGGLGAINRLSDFFQIYSSHSWGTVSYIKKFKTSVENRGKLKPGIYVKVLQEALPGEHMCGDGYFVKRFPDETHILVGDGLGHGPHALDAMTAAIDAFKEFNSNDPVEILRHLHTGVKKTRGLVGTIAILNHISKTWRIAGVGNISTRIYTGLEYKSYVPHNGIIGLNIPKTMTTYTLHAENFQTLIMCSDGIKTKWDLSKYNSILKYDPAIIAAAIFKDHGRRTDDMTVLVAKVNF